MKIEDFYATAIYLDGTESEPLRFYHWDASTNTLRYSFVSTITGIIARARIPGLQDEPFPFIDPVSTVPGMTVDIKASCSSMPTPTKVFLRIVTALEEGRRVA